MKTREGRMLSAIDGEFERKRFLRHAEKEKRFGSETYKSDSEIDHRTAVIFLTFARVLRGRGEMRKETKALERRRLNEVVRREVVEPLLNSYTEIVSSQGRFDEWHSGVVQVMKERCPIEWDGGSELTVGMAQKIINLHCKSLWTLELIQVPHAQFLHATIDETTLKHALKMRSSGWTMLNSYKTYMDYQLALRDMARRRSTYPMALETHIWYEHLSEDRKV